MRVEGEPKSNRGIQGYPCLYLRKAHVLGKGQKAGKADKPGIGDGISQKEKTASAGERRS